MKFDEYTNLANRIAESTKYLTKLPEIYTIISSTYNKKAFDIPKFVYEFPKIKIPKIELPRISFPKIDFEEVRKITANNSKYGWTLTGEMLPRDYLNRELIDMSAEETDAYFYSYYSYEDENGNLPNYKDAQKTIIDTIDSRWTSLVEECFKCYELGIFKVAIPNLIAIIEGEISLIANNNLIGARLLNSWKKDVDIESNKFSAIAMYSVFHFFQESLFLSRNFDEERPEVINRNWILHGRDDPSLWKVEDYFRLINTLSALQFVKDILNDEAF
ncbi:hypothetical protein ACTXGU_00210 [Niallia sp. 01092]|uniref:hypothetical protein n=1 Tax=Niallia sp. 01092 TaxID=3457759 RepID=UPI003FCF8B43